MWSCMKIKFLNTHIFQNRLIKKNVYDCMNEHWKKKRYRHSFLSIKDENELSRIFCLKEKAVCKWPSSCFHCEPFYWISVNLFPAHCNLMEEGWWGVRLSRRVELCCPPLSHLLELCLCQSLSMSSLLKVCLAWYKSGAVIWQIVWYWMERRILG